MSCQNGSRSCKITFNEKTIKAILGYSLFRKSLLSITEVSSVVLPFQFMFLTNHFYATVCIWWYCIHTYLLQQQYTIGIQLAHLLTHINIRIRCVVKPNQSWSTQICIIPSFCLPFLFLFIMEEEI